MSDADRAEGHPRGKGKPTPTRREAQAARKARMKPAVTRKEQAARERSKRSQVRAKQQEALRTGDDRYLPVRDRGPVKRMVRDLVDSRWNITEFLLPILVVILVLSIIQQPWAVNIANAAWLAVIVMSIFDSFLLTRAVKREVTARFGADQLKGTRFYGTVRATQLRRFRLPKPQVKRGQALPDRY